jgi:predicted transcriptional regulator of viral defense system
MADKGRPRLGRVNKGRPRSVELAALARQQHGVVSIRQLEQLFGYSRANVTRLVAVGQLHRVHRGVYAVGHTISPGTESALPRSSRWDRERC